MKFVLVANGVCVALLFCLRKLRLSVRVYNLMLCSDHVAEFITYSYVHGKQFLGFTQMHASQTAKLVQNHLHHTTVQSPA